MKDEFTKEEIKQAKDDGMELLIEYLKEKGLL